ncbi:hypothetical protein FQA39_LY00213 [Lamprigera yunnana]|nr:hypothetical protein FQA39_LY00213 [Lamprigera yunnana]
MANLMLLAFAMQIDEEDLVLEIVVYLVLHEIINTIYICYVIMGGCRCSYKNCIRATKNSDKDFHFFHYPARDYDRCRQWIINAQKMYFLDLPTDQLRNKVICQNHFEDHYFTNPNKRRLIHNAVPTIDMDSTEVKDEPMFNVRVRQSNFDGSVFTVDSNLLMVNEVGDVQSFRIENGNVIPAELSEEGKPEIENIEVYQVENTTTICNKKKVVNVNDKLQAKEDFPRNEVECSNNITSEDIVNGTFDNKVFFPASNLKCVTLKRKVKCHPTKNTSDLERLSKTIEQHTKEIAYIKRFMNLRIRRKLNLKKQREKVMTLNKLSSLLPPTLYALIKVHMFEKQDDFTPDEKRLLNTLKMSPSLYRTLIKDHKWKLPNFSIAQGKN